MQTYLIFLQLFVKWVKTVLQKCGPYTAKNFKDEIIGGLKAHSHRAKAKEKANTVFGFCRFSFETAKSCIYLFMTDYESPGQGKGRKEGRSGGSRISQTGGANPPCGGVNLLFCPIFIKNCMKMKEFWPRGGCASLAPPLDLPMGRKPQATDPLHPGTNMNLLVGVWTINHLICPIIPSWV